LGILNSVRKANLFQRQSRLILIISIGFQPPRQAEKKGIKGQKAAEMRFMKRTAGCSLLDCRTNKQILEYLDMDPLEKEN
jgi:hypothetical protein